MAGLTWDGEPLIARAWQAAEHPRVLGGERGGEFTSKPGAAPGSYKQRLDAAVAAVKDLTTDGALDYDRNKRAHLDSVIDIAGTAGKIPENLRPQLRERISQIKVESSIAVPGMQIPLGMTAAGYYEPDSHALHVAAESGVDHVVMHEMLHALDANLEGGHRFSSRRDWLALCRAVWADDYSKKYARGYFVPQGPADMARAGREMFAELLACYFEGKPLSLTHSGNTPLPPALDARVRAHFENLFGPPAAQRAVSQRLRRRVPLCVGVKRADGTLDYIAVDTTQAKVRRGMTWEDLCRATGWMNR